MVTKYHSKLFLVGFQISSFFVPIGISTFPIWETSNNKLKKTILLQTLFWHFTVSINCPNDVKYQYIVNFLLEPPTLNEKENNHKFGTVVCWMPYIFKWSVFFLLRYIFSDKNFQFLTHQPSKASMTSKTAPPSIYNKVPQMPYKSLLGIKIKPKLFFWWVWNI